MLHSHLLDDTVMAMPDANSVRHRLDMIPGYREAFAKVFGGTDAATLDNTAKALASYIRTLVTPGSDFDHYIRGNKSALSASARRGLDDFREIGCMACHFGPNFRTGAGTLSQDGRRLLRTVSQLRGQSI